MKRDRRRINAIWQFINPLGEIYTFAKVGSGKNSYTKTLQYLGRKNESNRNRPTKSAEMQ